MNITVLEPGVVEQSPLFATLLRFIFDDLPELEGSTDNLPMQGRLAVLGLLLLRNQSTKVERSDFSICRCIQVIVGVLWDAYVVDESNDPTALVVAMSYKEHSMEIVELWFLGVQRVAGIIQAIPWISEFDIEGGWASGIVETLREKKRREEKEKKIKIGTLPAKVGSAYEDFLCQLVDANEVVVGVLRKADAFRACRNHRLMDLGRKLFGN